MEYRLMNEYTVDWPLWRDDGGAPEGEPELSERLAAQVRDWAATFNELYSYKTGWPDARTCQAQRAEGEHLAAAIARELGPDDSIELDFWETAHAGRNDRGTRRR
ncbi:MULTISPECIES: hypothetical protein [unclassified Curtobacterium]|uniref:hypothetical protein n=1 Tax=unclassified Curtobacterium TaxID=257496 RepID=UPI000DB09C23|nr:MULTISPECIES: hypothetical protein [unclassified Curtobacterium]WIB63201.1 hypothetical protein DEI94_13765 [Curtobacterium sp. MCBD17_040]